MKAQEPESARRKRDDGGLSGRIKLLQDDFDLAMLVGESEAANMTISDYVFYGLGPNNLLNSSVHNMIPGDSQVAIEVEAVMYATKYSAILEPTSGFNTALQNVHSHVLETYISVLSSISSHILHRIFYDVIEDALCASPVDSSQKSAAKPSASFKQSNANTSLVNDLTSNEKSHSRA